MEKRLEEVWSRAGWCPCPKLDAGIDVCMTKPISHVVNGMIISHAIHANRGMRSPLGWKRSQVVKGVLPDRPQKDDSHKDGGDNILVAVRPMETLSNPNNPLTMQTDDHDNELYDPSCLCWVNPDMCRSKWCLLNDHDDGAHDEEPPAPQPSLFTPIGLKAYFGAFLAIMVLSVMSPTNVRRVGLLGVRAGKGCSGMCCTVTVKFTRGGGCKMPHFATPDRWTSRMNTFRFPEPTPPSAPKDGHKASSSLTDTNARNHTHHTHTHTHRSFPHAPPRPRPSTASCCPSSRPPRGPRWCTG
jgi:hypothetical protein